MASYMTHDKERDRHMIEKEREREDSEKEWIKNIFYFNFKIKE
jgi:hypothetical protein